MSVQHDNSTLRSEPDIVVVSSAALAAANARSSRKKMLEAAADIVGNSFPETGLINIQCKTNWNDTAQVPMLWNMLYNQAWLAVDIRNGFSIGKNGFSLNELGHFGYAFVTVPTQKDISKFKPHSLAVLRAKTMTAGNYWGYRPKNGVSRSLSEFFDIFNLTPKVFPRPSEAGKVASEAKADSIFHDSFAALRLK